MNFLEQLAAEWYATQGYFVRTNAKANRRAQGGWGNELDVLAFKPGTGELVHLETSWDALTWDGRKDRFITKKFVFSLEEYEQLIGLRPSSVRKRAVVGTSVTCPETSWAGDIEVVTVPRFVAEICAGLKGRHPLRDIVPETYPRLRAMQFAMAFGDCGQDRGSL